jgi:hypothetical protein
MIYHKNPQLPDTANMGIHGWVDYKHICRPRQKPDRRITRNQKYTISQTSVLQNLLLVLYFIHAEPNVIIVLDDKYK